MKNIIKQYILLFLLISIGTLRSHAQTTCSTPASTINSNNEVISIKKCFVTNDSPVRSGDPITYIIQFQISNPVNNLVIRDLLPSNLIYVSQLSTITGMTFNQSTLTWNANSLAAGSYTINITVKFPEGTTCNGEEGLNRVAISADGFPEVITDKNATPIIAKVSNGWKIIKKARNPFYISPDPEVIYDISIVNNLGKIGSSNISNPVITDLLPAGASLVSSNCTFTNLDVLAPNASNQSNTPYRCQITVKYPTSNFSNNSCPENTIKLYGINSCDEPYVSTDTDKICIVDTIPLNNSVSFSKTVNNLNPVPGCLGFYLIKLKNNGNSTITDYHLQDNFPPEIDVHKIHYQANGTPLIYNSGSCSGTTMSNIDCNGTNIPGLTVQPTNFAPGEEIKIWVYFTIKIGYSPNHNIRNIADLESINASIDISDTVDFKIKPYAPNLKIRKKICQGSSVYNPGDIFTYRIKVQNAGSQDFLGGIFTDVLDSKLEYLGNSGVKIYKTTAGNSVNISCSTASGVPPQTTDITSSTPFNFNTTTNTFTSNLPNIQQDCSGAINYGWSLSNALETYFIEFQVKVKPGTVLGQIHNSASISNNNHVFKSNQKTITIQSLSSLTIKKSQVIAGSGLNYTTSTLSAFPGNIIRYNLEISNTGNINFKNLKLVDILPNIGDASLRLGCPNRGSTVNSILVNSGMLNLSFPKQVSSQLLPSTIAEFGTSCPGSTAPNWSNSASPVKSIKIESIPTFVLAPLSSITFSVAVKIPPNATPSDVLCNDFTIICEDLTGIKIDPYTSNTVCVNINPFPRPDINCCETDLSIWNPNDGNIYPTAPQNTMVNGIHLSWAEEIFQLHQNSAIPITELKVNIDDIKFEYNYDQCSECVKNSALWGSIYSFDTVIGTAPGSLNQVPSFTLNRFADNLTNKVNKREIVWENPNGAMLNSGDKFKVGYLLPPLSELPCCARKVKICIKISWKDANCRTCVRYTCSEINLEQTPITEESLQLSIKKEGCCNRVIDVITGNTQAQYKWSTGAKTKSIVVDKNGQYSVTVQAGGSTITKSILVTDILSGNFPLLSFNSLFHPDFVPPYKNKFYLMDVSPNKITQGKNNSYNAFEYKLEIWHRWNTHAGQGKPLKIIEGKSMECQGFDNWDIFWDGTDQNGNILKKEKSDSYVWRLTLKNCTNESSRLTYKTTWVPICEKKRYLFPRWKKV